MIRNLVGLILIAVCFPNTSARADAPGFAGSWKTTFGVVTLKANGDSIEGTFGPGGRSTIQGTVKDNVLKATYKEAQAEGELTFTLDPAGHAYTGRFQLKNGRAGFWNGWRPDPEASKDAMPANFAGLWLTDLGLMKLTQDGAKVSGKYAVRGGSTIEGTVTGRHLEFRYQSYGAGPAWLDLSADGKTLSGASGPDGPGGWSGWKGRRATEYEPHAPLVAGKMVEGSTDNLLTYTVRAPESYKSGDPKKWPAIVILHGSNMNGQAYVNTLAAAWPDIAREYILLGINGEIPSNIAPDNPQFNYSYVNFVGKSTFKGFPGTDRESPALVSAAMTELKAVYPIKYYFVGGHSQGGFLTYSLLMNYPEALAGAFPISSGLIFQCEPSAYADAAVKKAQRAVPLAIIHGKNDPVLGFGMSDYAARAFGEANWPALRFFTDDQAAHMFGRLPVGPAIRWLEALNSQDPKSLAEFARKWMKEANWRDAIAAVNRAKAIDPTATEIVKIALEIDAKAEPEAKKYAALIAKNADGSWVDGFLAFRDQFEFADVAKDAMAAFAKLRSSHDEPAQKLRNEARGLFQQGKADQAYAKYQELVDKYYAASSYRDTKKALAQKK
jgi:predicted esterase